MSMILTAAILIELCFDGRRVWPCAVLCVESARRGRSKIEMTYFITKSSVVCRPRREGSSVDGRRVNRTASAVNTEHTPPRRWAGPERGPWRVGGSA